MTDHVEALRRAATRYRQAQVKADQIMRGPRDELARTVRAAYAGKLRKSDILRAMDHVWSRTWLDATLKEADTDQQTG